MVADQGAISETKCNYHAFLSFRGKDTREGFTGHLYAALTSNGINTFMDDENLRKGEQIGAQLLQAIEESKFSIIVFSENYAASPWCLDELVKIHKCKEEKNQDVFPIFYKVEPSDVRHLKNSYGEAMSAHENRFGNDSERVQEWRSALFHISNLSGYHLKEGYEFKFIQDIVSNVITKLPPKQLHIEEHLVGLESQVEELKSFLDMEFNSSTCMLGIHGTGGIGKTTLAKALYNSICNQFESACFLFNIRETSNQDKGQLRLQQMLLLDILKEGKIELGNVHQGISTIKERLCKKRVLIVLDDVDQIEQLKELAGGCDWFGSRSRIIITTRDKFLLVAHARQVKKTYEMNVLDAQESLELFCQNAFKMNHPATNYEGLSNRAIRYAKGLPLALKVIGSNLIGKDLNEWKSALDKYEKNPHKDIHSILRISYDSLECNEKDIFLDIACFFNGQKLDYVKRILDGCEFFPEDGIRTLVDKSLITVENGCLRMHDLIQEMGREIVKQEAPKEASERSRLWFHEDILELLKENTGSSKIEGIKLDYSEEVKRIHATFEKMRKLRILIVQNTTFSSGPIYLPNQLRLLDWKGYPSQSFPPGFYPEKIAAFNLRCSAIVLDKPFQKFEHLTYMNFSYSQSITQFPDVSGATNLKELRLDRCTKLVKVDDSVGFLPNLVYLSASGCSQLKSFVVKICLPSLEYLCFSLCRRLEHFPDIMGKMDKPLKINMRKTAIKELPHSFCNLTGLNHADMTSCRGLRDLPSNLFMLPNFVTLKIGGCSQLRESLRRFQRSQSIADWCLNLETLHISSASLSDEDLDIIIRSFPNLKDLNVSSNHFVSFPACIQDSNCLTSLDVSYCVKLEEIPELPSSVQKVDARHCNSLTAKTSNKLWSRVRKEINRLEIVMPETDFPEWFDYHEEGGIPMFWARGKLPIVAIAFVFEKVKYEVVGLQVLVDGKHVHGQRQKYLHNFSVAKDHLLLCDMRVLLSDEDWTGVDARFRHDNDWKCVNVKCGTEMILRFWGVYAYKQETNINDIRFTCPNSWARHLAWTMDKNVDDQEPCETASRNELEVSSASGEEASCLESDDSESPTHTCSPFCISILSSLTKLICCNATTKTTTTIAPPPQRPEPKKPKERPPRLPPRPEPEELKERPEPEEPKERPELEKPKERPPRLQPPPEPEEPKERPKPEEPKERPPRLQPRPEPEEPKERPKPEKPKERPSRPPSRRPSRPPPGREPEKPKEPPSPPPRPEPQKQPEKATPPLPRPLSPLAASEPLPLPPPRLEKLKEPEKPKPLQPKKPKPLRPEKPKESEKPKEPEKPIPPPQPQATTAPPLSLVGAAPPPPLPSPPRRAAATPLGMVRQHSRTAMQHFFIPGWGGGPVDNTSLDFEKQMLLPSSSESLQTVVGNLKRIMAVSSDEEESESESEA